MGKTVNGIVPLTVKIRFAKAVRTKVQPSIVMFTIQITPPSGG
jgi:hypothetical protein